MEEFPNLSAEPSTIDAGIGSQKASMNQLVKQTPQDEINDQSAAEFESQEDKEEVKK